jgi:hypothetical protein
MDEERGTRSRFRCLMSQATESGLPVVAAKASGGLRRASEIDYSLAEAGSQ